MAKPLILIVDDEIEYADELAKSLKLTGKYETIVAYSAKEANKALKKNKGVFGVFKNKIRCILLDIKMPEIDGLQFLEELRKEYDAKIEVILVTAYEDEEKWEKATDGLIAGYVTKPFNKYDLFSKLEKLFSSKDSRIEMIGDTLMEGFEKREKRKKA
ncbi:MAG: response regulator [Candidatus Margulisbacteria bacterium]|nr:response regulator [Candidatus Margulisiibacteriota bacterium]